MCAKRVADLSWKRPNCHVEHGGEDPRCHTDIASVVYNVGTDLKERVGDNRAKWLFIFSDFDEDTTAPQITAPTEFGDVNVVLVHPDYPPGHPNPGSHVDSWENYFKGAATVQRRSFDTIGGGSPLTQNPTLNLPDELPAEPKGFLYFFAPLALWELGGLLVVGTVTYALLHRWLPR
jgi:hypothetical protein